jgi:hypothetical protein
MSEAAQASSKGLKLSDFVLNLEGCLDTTGTADFEDVISYLVGSSDF